MSESDELVKAKKLLFDALGENLKQYLGFMKLWFQMKNSKEEFDQASRKLLSSEQVHLHNEFLLGLLAKCSVLSPHPPPYFNDQNGSRDKTKRPAKMRKRNRSDKGGFQPMDLYDNMCSLPSLPAHIQNESVRFCLNERFVPDVTLVYSRMVLGAWEQGLDTCEDAAAEILSSAVKRLLKNIIQAIIARRTGYRVRDNCFIYGPSNHLPSPWLKDTAELLCVNKRRYGEDMDREIGVTDDPDNPVTLPTYEDIEQRAAHELGCSVYNSLKEPINMYDVLESIQVHRNLIPSQSVFGLFECRVLDKLYHPSHEELEIQNCVPSVSSVK